MTVPLLTEIYNNATKLLNTYFIDLLLGLSKLTAETLCQLGVLLTFGVSPQQQYHENEERREHIDKR